MFLVEKGIHVIVLVENISHTFAVALWNMTHKKAD